MLNRNSHHTTLSHAQFETEKKKHRTPTKRMKIKITSKNLSFLWIVFHLVSGFFYTCLFVRFRITNHLPFFTTTKSMFMPSDYRFVYCWLTSTKVLNEDVSSCYIFTNKLKIFFVVFLFLMLFFFWFSLFLRTLPIRLDATNCLTVNRFFVWFFSYKFFFVRALHSVVSIKWFVGVISHAKWSVRFAWTKDIFSISACCQTNNKQQHCRWVRHRRHHRRQPCRWHSEE